MIKIDDTKNSSRFLYIFSSFFRVRSADNIGRFLFFKKITRDRLTPCLIIHTRRALNVHFPYSILVRFQVEIMYRLCRVTIE